MVICNIRGCDVEASEVVAAENESGFFEVPMCSYHYREYRSDESLGKEIQLKGVPVQERHN